MPLTRHLYELDEVVSALQTCLRLTWPISKSLFWTWELVQSEESTLARTSLIDSWFSWGGGYDPTLLAETDWITLTQRIHAAIKQAGTVNTMRFLKDAAAMPTRPSVTPKPRTTAARVRRAQRSQRFLSLLSAEEQVEPQEAKDWWISYDSACRQGAVRDAMWLLQAVQPLLSSEGIWTAINVAARANTATILQMIQDAASETPESQITAQATATLLLCRHRVLVTPVEPINLGHYKRDWATWTADVGRRRARLYPIPTEALHTGTTRGSMSKIYTNINELREPVPGLGEACAWWRSVLKTDGITEQNETDTIEFPNDDVLESFHDRYFPDDNPDEWSAVDQQKSHGRGCLETAVGPYVPAIREEPVSRGAWRMAIHVRP